MHSCDSFEITPEVSYGGIAMSRAERLADVASRFQMKEYDGIPVTLLVSPNVTLSSYAFIVFRNIGMLDPS